jgi:hypothetical protein
MKTKKLFILLIAMLVTILPLQAITASSASVVDTTLATFTVDDTSVEDGDLYVATVGTTSVNVVAIPSDPDASVLVTGAAGLVAGDNNLQVLVTGSDLTTTSLYVVDIYVMESGLSFSNDASLADLKVNGNSIVPNQLIEVAPLTSVVTVAVYTTSVGATSVVTGARNLVTGLNTVSVAVTAEDGTTRRIYTFKIRVLALPADVSLSTFAVNGQAVRNGGRLYLAPGTNSVTVTATPNESSSSVLVTGASGLVAGTNTLTAVVTAQSDSTATYSVTLYVQKYSDISSLSVFKVSGVSIANGDTVLVPAGTTAVEVTAIPTDSAANVVITGSSGLKLGDNALKVVVTAEDGSVTNYSATLNVLASDDTSLAVFQYNGSDVQDGDSFDLEYGTTSVEIDAQATSDLATVDILGTDALTPGKNTVRINVTAQDGSLKTYRLLFNLAANNDATYESLTVAGQDASGGSISLPAGSRAAAISVVTTDPLASYTIDGGSELEPGENMVTVTVTAADGETTADYPITITVTEQSDDTSGSLFTVNGLEVADGDALELHAGTTHVNVKFVTTSEFATYSITGDGVNSPEPLKEGDNSLIVTVIAQDGTIATNTVTLTVAAVSTNSDLGEENPLTIDGQAVDLELLNNAAGYYDMPLTTTRISVAVTAADSAADVFVNGKTALAGVGRTFSVEKGVNSISVEVVPPAGVNFAKTYVLQVYVGGADATVKTVKVNATTIVLNDDNEGTLAGTLPNGTAKASLFVDPTVSLKSGNTPGTKVEFDAGDATVTSTSTANTYQIDGLTWGENRIAITVIPGDDTMESITYTVTINVALADATVKTVKVNGTSIVFNGDNEGKLAGTLASGTAKASLFVEPTVPLKSGNSAGTRVEFDAGDATVTSTSTANTYQIDRLAAGENTIAITIVPNDESVDPITYTVTINVALSSDKRLKTFLVNGAPVKVGSTLILPLGTESAELDAVTESPLATFEVSGADALKIGKNTATITVTAQDETTQSYTVTIIVPRKVDVIVVGFPKAGVITVDAKTNKAGNKTIANELKKIGKSTVVRVDIANNFSIAKDKPTAARARAAAIQKYLQAQKTLGLKTAIYKQVAGPKKQKGTTVTIYYY